MKILVVDDDEAVLQWVRKQLEARRYEVDDAFSGEQGLRSYLTQGPTTWTSCSVTICLFRRPEYGTGSSWFGRSALSTPSNE